jgi:NADH-quinone oxidoreductase subunit L
LTESVNWLWFIPVLPLLGSALCGALHFAILRKRRIGAGAEAAPDSLTPLAAWIATGEMAIIFVLAVRAFLLLRAGADTGLESLESQPWNWINTGDFDVQVSMVVDRLSSVMILVVTGVGFLIHVYAAGYMKGDPGYAKFFAYMNLFVAMMLMLVLSSSLVGMFVGWEGVGLCSYLLIGFWYSKGWPAEAAQKAFVVNRIGDAFFLLGMFLLVRVFGTLDMSDIGAGVAQVMEEQGGTLALAALLLFGGACGKSAQLPLFVWLPDAMAGPTPVSALIHAATMVTSGIYLIVRLNPLFASAPNVLFFIGTIGAVTAAIAGSTAIVQRDLKKVLAYSTVSQLGYMFLALGAGAWASAIFHLVTHAFFKALLFLGAGSVIHGMHDEQDMHRMGGLRKYMPRTFLTFTVGAAALSGLPLLSGFFSKDEILAQTLARGGGYWILWGLGVLTAMMTAYYSWRAVSLTFFGEERFDVDKVHPHESGPLMTTPLFVLAGLSIVAGALGLPEVFHVAHALKDWLEPVVAPGNAILMGEHGHAPHLSHATEWILLGFGAAIALGFAHLGFHGHRGGTQTDERLFAEEPAAARFLTDAWGIDRAYGRLIVQPLKTLSYIVAVVVDQFVIDGVVNGAAAGARSIGTKLRRMADGNIATYGLWMGAVSVALTLVWMLIGAAA